MTSQLLTKRVSDAPSSEVKYIPHPEIHLVGEKGTERAKAPLVPGEQQAL